MGPSRPSDIAGDGPSSEGSDNDELAAGDLSRMASGDLSPRTRELGARNKACPPALEVTEDRKRNMHPPLEHTPNARPRVRARTGKGSTVQSDGDEFVSGGSGTMPGKQSSNASSRGGAITRSGRVPINSVISGGQPIAKKRVRKRLCGLDKCGSASEWAMPKGAACVDCGAAHTGNEFLCAACHRPEFDTKRWILLGPSMYAQAMAWFEQCRAAGEGLPTCVVESFVPSTSCLCLRSDCFYAFFAKYQRKAPENICVPCGSTKSVYLRSGGERPEQYYQLFFEGVGRNRADGGMLKTKEVITAESTICNCCHMAFHKYVTTPGRHPTAKELLAAPVGPQLPQGSVRVKSAVKGHIYEALAAGKVVCSEDIEARVVTERRANNIEDASAGYARRIALKILQDLRCWGRESIVMERSEKTDALYLIPTSDRDDMISGLDREVQTMNRENEDLRQQLRGARRDRENDVA